MSPEQLRPADASPSPATSDFDMAYGWGRPPSTYLAPRQCVRLMIYRSRLDDRHLLRNRAPLSEPSE